MEYIGGLNSTIAEEVACRPIYELYVNAERMLGDEPNDEMVW